MRPKPVILLSLLVAAFAINLETTMVNVALPALSRELHATTSQLQWIVDAFILVFAALLLTAGSLSDRFGRKGMLIAGLAVFGASSVIAGFTTSPAGLIAARACMGLGAAMTFPPTLSLISNVFTDRKQRAQAIGLWGATVGVAVAAGPIVGGWLLNYFSWGSIFFAMGPVAALAMVMAAIAIPTSRGPAVGRVDIAGLVLSAAAMATVIYTIIQAPTYGWGAGRTIGGFVASGILFVAFATGERRVEHPMLDIRIFTNMRFTAASGSVTIAFFTLFGFTFLIVQYFQFIQGYSALAAGVHLLPVAASLAGGSVIGTQLAVKIGTKLVVTTGMALVTGFYLWIAVVQTATTSYGIIAAQMVVLGVGMGFTSAPATESIMGAVNDDHAGVGSAVNDSSRLLGGALGVAVLGSIYASLFNSGLTRMLPHRLPGSLTSTAHQSVGAAFTVSEHLAGGGQAALAATVHTVATNAFLHGFTVACAVAGGVSLLGVALAAVFIPAQPLVLAGSTGDPETGSPATRPVPVAASP